MTVAILKKRFVWARSFGNTMIEERLFDAGLAWLRRRRKSIVTETYIAERVAYCEAVGRKHQSTLDTWAYNDGTVFYLDRTKEENDHTQHAALGGWVWRCSDASDAMYQDCLAPSSYKKAQGTPVRVWGVLAEGSLYIHVLEEGEVMDQTLYEELIEDRFEHWLGSCTYLVSDFERCLRSDGPLSALKKLQVTLVEGYPRCSQDFNAIENCWKILRTRLCETLPKGLEGRDAFVERLKKAVQWINRAERKQLWYLSKPKGKMQRLLEHGTTWRANHMVIPLAVGSTHSRYCLFRGPKNNSHSISNNKSNSNSSCIAFCVSPLSHSHSCTYTYTSYIYIYVCTDTSVHAGTHPHIVCFYIRICT